ncbi:recombinase family protein [Lachnospiraceae bacterium 66-29]
MDKNNSYISYMAAVYLRLSKEDEDLREVKDKKESNSIANQKALILKTLESMPDVTLYDIYIDDGFTGLNFERPNFQRMCEDIYNGRVNMVIVKDLSRLGRDYIDSGRYVKKIFPSYHVRFVSVLDHFDSLTATQSDVNLLIPVKNFVNDNYSRDISGKVRSHQEVMRENGLYIGSHVAYGYKKLETDRNRIIPDEYAADIVRKIFDWKLKGLSSASIADKLNELGVAAPSEYKRQLGGNYKSGFQKNRRAKWSAVTINRILKNKIYIGVLEQGKREKVNYKLNKVVEKPESEWAVKENTHEAIISKADFENVAKLLNLDTRKSPEEETLFMLSGLMFCGECGRSMVRRCNRYKDKQSIYYICATYNKGKGCSRHSIGQSVVEDILLDAIKRHIEHVARLDELLSTIRDREVNYDDIVANDREILAKYKELDQCKKVEMSLHRDLAAGIISIKEYEQFKNKFAHKSAEIEATIRKLQEEIETVFKEGLFADEWIDTFTKTGNITSLDRSIVLSLVEKITIHEENRIEITFKYQDEYETLCRIISRIANPTEHIPVSLKEVGSNG